MLEKIVIFSDLNLSNRYTRYNLQIYEILRQKSQLPVYLYGSNQPGLHKLIGSHLFISDKISQIKDSLIVLLGYHRSLTNLDPSNEVMYFLEKPFNSTNSLLLPVLNKILTYDAHTAHKISVQVQASGFQTPVIKLYPWFNADNYQIYYRYGNMVGYHEIDDYYLRLFPAAQRINDFRGLYIYAALSKLSSVKDVIAAMLSGIPVIALDEPPFNELITHGYNGYLVRTENDIQTVMNHLKQNRLQIINSARNHLEKLFDPILYYSKFSQVIQGNFYNYNNFKIELSERKWIVRNQILSAGQIEFYPQSFSKSFKTVDLQDFMDIIEYFSKNLFTEVYVFGCEFNEYDLSEIKQISRMINRMGDRARKLHFCLDEVPSQFNKIFEKLSLISVSEGLKQVK